MLETVNLIESAISPGRLLSYVEGFSHFHRIQASQGHRDAAGYISSVLENNGVTVKILKYPADYGISYLGRKAFKEWNCRHAELMLIDPEEIVLADFSACATSIIQKSAPCDFMSSPLEIVLLDKGDKEENYKELDLKGKLVFVRDDFIPYVKWAVKKRGALGIISDFVIEDKNARTRHDMYDVSKYCSFWYHKEPEAPPFGFSITPRLGDKLAEICKTSEKYPRAVCRIDAEFSPGNYEVVEAEIKGQSDEEIWLLAHSCHPKSSANDNASGVAAAVEAISVIKRLIEEKKIKPLKRTLKIILMAEFSGTFPYLSDHLGVKCLAALNMDMVGGKQELGYGPLTIVGLPLSTPSFVADLCGAILNELKKEVRSLSADSYLPMFNSQRVTYSGGSDHLILSDPSIGIPSPMLLQWPDVFYHTSGDTIDKISPKLISKSAALAASYAYTLCNLDLCDVRPILGEALTAFMQACVEAIEKKTEQRPVSLEKALGYIYEFYSRSALSFRDWFTDGEADEIINGHISILTALFESLKQNFCLPEASEQTADNLEIPFRTQKAVVINLHEFAEDDKMKKILEDYEEKYSQKQKSDIMPVLTQYYIDGKRNISEIAERVAFEACLDDCGIVAEYICLLKDLRICVF